MIIREENIPWESKRNSSCPYWYITKHGIGPGTLPKDVKVGKTKDLDNYYTIIWIDRPLSTDELKYYDIYPETENRTVLTKLGYDYSDFNKSVQSIKRKNVINPFDESLKETWLDDEEYLDAGDTIYEAKAYYDKSYRGLAASEEFPNAYELDEWIWNMCQRGFYVEVYDYEDNEYSYYRWPDNAEYMELYEPQDLETDRQGNFLYIDDVGPK